MISRWGIWLAGALLAVASGQPTNSSNSPASPASDPQAGLEIGLCVDIQIGGTAYRPNFCGATGSPTVTQTVTTTCFETVTTTKTAAHQTITTTKTITVSGAEITKIATKTVVAPTTVESEKDVTKTETDENTITSFIVSTKTDVITTSYPYTVTVTNGGGYPEVSTVWVTTTTTKTLLSTIAKPTTVPVTVKETDSVWLTTTATKVITTSIPYTITVTDSNGYPVTTTKWSTITSTVTATSTYAVTETATVAKPTTVIEPGTTVIEPGTTVVRPGTTVREPGTTVVEPGTTVVEPGTTVVLPGTTVQGPGTTVVIPASTITSTFTTTLPGSVTTITQAGTTVTSTLPGVTSVVTTTITLPAQTTTVLGGQTTVSSTVTVTGQVVCPKPTNSGAVTPQDTGKDATWGCSPGYVCDPPKPNGCTLWADPPDVDYLCDAKFCVPSPDFPSVVWPDGQTGYYPPTEGYFNLNPNAFGLGYGIFEETVVTQYVLGGGASKVLTTATTGDWTSQPGLGHYPPAATSLAVKKREIPRRPVKISKRDSSVVPAVCFSTCNTGFLEVQKVGKIPSLCNDDSPFEADYRACQECAVAHGDSQKQSLQTYVVPEFAQFVDFCNAQPAQSAVLPPSTSTDVVVPVAETHSVVVATSTASTPTTNVDVTAPANTQPAATSSSEPNAGPAPTSRSNTTTGAPSTTTQPLQVTGASPNLTPSSSFKLITSIFVIYALSLLL